MNDQDAAADGAKLNAAASLLLSRKEAASLLGMSLRHFQRHVQRDLPQIRTGSMVQFTRADLQAWIEAKQQGTTPTALSAQAQREARIEKARKWRKREMPLWMKLR